MPFSEKAMEQIQLQLLLPVHAGTGAVRVAIDIDNLTSRPRYAANGLTASIYAHLFYDRTQKMALGVLIDGNRGASITNCADRLLPFLIRAHLTKMGILWSESKWIYRDTLSSWSEIKVFDWDGSNFATVGIQKLLDDSEAGAMSQAASYGFSLSSEDRRHLALAISRVRVSRAAA